MRQLSGVDYDLIGNPVKIRNNTRCCISFRSGRAGKMQGARRRGNRSRLPAITLRRLLDKCHWYIPGRRKESRISQKTCLDSRITMHRGITVDCLLQGKVFPTCPCAQQGQRNEAYRAISDIYSPLCSHIPGLHGMGLRPRHGL